MRKFAPSPFDSRPCAPFIFTCSHSCIKSVHGRICANWYDRGGGLFQSSDYPEARAAGEFPSSIFKPICSFKSQAKCGIFTNFDTYSPPDSGKLCTIQPCRINDCRIVCKWVTFSIPRSLWPPSRNYDSPKPPLELHPTVIIQPHITFYERKIMKMHWVKNLFQKGMRSLISQNLCKRPDAEYSQAPET